MASKKKTPARGAGGKFVSSGGSKPRARRAMVRTSAPVVLTTPAAFVRGSAPAKAKPKKRRRVGGGGGVGLVPYLKRQIKPMAGSAAYGWITSADSETAGKIRTYVKKIPVIDALGAPATHGILAAFVATKTKGRVREVFDVLAQGALMRFAYNVGAKNGSLENAAKLAGADDDDRGVNALRGSIDADEATGYDDDDMGDDDVGDDYDDVGEDYDGD